MRILFVLPYGPSETRVRSRMLLTELAQRHEITLVGLSWNASDRQALAAWAERGIAVRAIPHGPRSWAPIAYRAFWQPLQRIVATSPALTDAVRSVIAEAAAAGRPFDVVHIEHLRGASAANMLIPFGIWTVYDAVDCISDLARLTWLRNPSPLTRLVAWRETEPTRRLERALATAADVTTVVSERDARSLQQLCPEARIEVVPNGVSFVAEPSALTSEPRVIFTGKLSYHANQAAARWLLDAIWPWVHLALPDARLIIAGADPPHWLEAERSAQNVTVIANPPDIQALIAQARVAVAPMTYSVGVQNKILEAMACGVPVVATPVATGGLHPDAASALLESNDERGFAAEIIRLLADDKLARRIGQHGHDYTRAHHSWQAAAAQLEALYVPDRVMQWTA